MGSDHIWATDVEIMAVSMMLGIDLFVANFHCDSKKTYNEIRWYRYHFYEEHRSNQAMYLTNFDEHFQPVTDLINCRYQSYFTSDSFSSAVVIDDE